MGPGLQLASVRRAPCGSWSTLRGAWRRWWWLAALVGGLVWWRSESAPERRPPFRVEVVPALHMRGVRTLAFDAAARGGDAAAVCRFVEAGLGDELRVEVPRGAEARLYFGQDVVMRCGHHVRSASCLAAGHGSIGAALLRSAGTYHVLALSPPLSSAPSSLDADLAEVPGAGASCEVVEVTVR